MPMTLLVRFQCNQCGVEYNVPATVEVLRFPVSVPMTVKQPPQGWTCEGVQARCPEHASKVLRLVDIPVSGQGN